MTPHELMEAAMTYKGHEVGAALVEILSASQHFDAGFSDEIPWGKDFHPDVRPPFQATTVVVHVRGGSSVLYGCWEDQDGDGRWLCFHAVDSPKGPAVGFFRFCPKSLTLSLNKGWPGNEEEAQFGSSFLNQFFAVIACSNVRVVDVPAPAALNKKRIRNGKRPISAHKVLHLVAPTAYSKSEHQGGTHSSPRVHLRRGHIRKLPSGATVWVQQCVVGSKHGIVTKDYAVSYAATAA